MAPSDWELFFGKGAKRPDQGLAPSPQQQTGPSMSFVEAYTLKRQYGPNAILPPDMRPYTLEELRLRAEEEKRPLLEAQAREAVAKRVEQSATAVRRAMAPKPRRSGWRLRVSFLDHFQRAHSVAEAAARTGIDETTARRWRRKFPAFNRRWVEIVESRERCAREELALRAGQPQVVRRYFFRGKPVGELMRHDDRAVMYMGQRAERAKEREEDRAQRAKEREEDRAERREIRAHELEMRRLELAARKEVASTPGFSGHDASGGGDRKP